MLKTVLATSLFLASVLGVDINITSVEEFKIFAADASTYDIVRLYTDLDFTGKDDVTPIAGFQGMFYGNGHVIKGLKMTSDALNIGIFATLSDSKVKDLIIDSSCEFKGTYASSLQNEVNVGSVVGKCDKCNFENIINHANVSYEGTGTQADSVYVGGIAGTFSSETNTPATMKNVANYGAVSNNLSPSAEEKFAAAGGIVGFSIAYSPLQKLQYTNCLNYGEVTTSNNLQDATGTGGIVGIARAYPYFKNIVSAASCSAQTTSAGSVIGLGYSIGSATFENCYATSDTTKKLIGSTANGFTSDESEATAFDFKNETFDQLNSETGYANVWVNNENAKNITFKVNDNSEYASTSKVIIAPVLSSESPYFFKGWYSDESCETAYTVSEAPTGEKSPELRGGWQYTLTIKGNGGKIGSLNSVTKNVIYMHLYGTLPEATREGYTFAKWTDAAEGGNEVNESTKLETLGNTEIYAQWTINQYTITFNFFNGTEEPLVMTYDYQETVTYPENPTRFEHAFDGWASDYGSSLNNTSMPAKNVIINATWKLNEYQVVFHIYEGNDIPYTLGYGTNVTYPADPTRTGYTFVGWDNDNVTTTPSGGITINAKWNINTYFVTFDFDNGTDSLIMEVTYNDPIKYPDNATKKGFEFQYYVSDDKINYDNMPAKNLTFTAEFRRFVYTYTFVKDGKQVTEIKYAFDQEFKLPDGPKKTMYKFDKWCIKDSDICEPFTADNLPEGAAYFEAKYKIDTAILAVTIVIPGAAVIALIVVLIILLVMRKKRTARRKVPPKKKDVEMDS